MQNSTLHLRNVTCIDHAFVTEGGLIQGGSYHPHITVTGQVDEHEQVVVDFSKIKKQIKDCIDSKENGFDHKLWLIENYSNASVLEQDGVVYVETDKLSLKVPDNAIKKISNPRGSLNLELVVANQMAQELKDYLEKENGNSFIVTVQLTRDTFGSKPIKFTYWHGLKDSSSWGCNNIAHGHTSFVEVYDDEGYRQSEMERMIAHYLNGALLVYDQNLKGKNHIAYETPRGRFELIYNEGVKHIVMDKETTIENIVEHINEVFHATLEFYRVEKIFISEGLQKGAIKFRTPRE